MHNSSRTLYLHVGHFKTGSSWIQGVLKHKREVLATCGRHYPKIDVESADFYDASSGNIGNLWITDTRVKTVFNSQSKGEGVVLSSEFLFDRLPRLNYFNEFKVFLASEGFDRLRVLLLIRNPIALISSGWMQFQYAR